MNMQLGRLPAEPGDRGCRATQRGKSSDRVWSAVVDGTVGLVLDDEPATNGWLALPLAPGLRRETFRAGQTLCPASADSSGKRASSTREATPSLVKTFPR